MKRKNQLKLSKIMSRYLLSTFFAFLLSGIGGIQAQQITVRGVVTDAESGETLIGVNILLEKQSGESSTLGTVTDIDGNYTIDAAINDVLSFSYTGMETKNISITSELLNVVMDPAAVNMDEIVVIGYGTARKKEIAGAVTQIKSKELQRINTADVASALQGQVAGVSVIAGSGEPGAAAQIQIRGITSLNGSNTPLFVVDGIPQDGDPRLSRNEIETIDILKDAASASIYGTRGAAGVILITTKQGKEGKTKVSLDALYGTQRINEGLPLMNANDQIYFETLREKYVDGTNGPAVNNNPDWLNNDTDLRNLVQNDGALSKSYNLGLSGGVENFSYNVVGGVFNQEGILINSGFKRYNARVNTNYKKGRWNIRAITSVSTEKNERLDGGLLLLATRYLPYFPDLSLDQEVFDIFGGESETQTNFLVQRFKRTNVTNRDRINGSLNVGFEIAKGLKLNANLGSGITSIRGKEIIPPFSTRDLETGEIESDPTRNYIEQNSSRARTYSWDAGLTYRKKMGKHTITALGSFSVDERAYEYFEAGRQGIANNSIEVLNIGTINPYANSGVGNQQNYVIKTVGTLGRLMYNYNDRYLLSASVRRDGSSKFAEENRWGVFPSVSAAWNISSESFWEPLSNVSDNFKLRASYGTTGNESFPAYQYSTVVNQGADYYFGNIESFGAVQSNFANGLVKWETSQQINIGIDLGLWQNKLTFTADVYNTKKKDMLFPIRLPSSAGALSGNGANLILNVGDMTNQGVELALNYRSRIGKLKWNIGAIYTKNVNEITSINGSTDLIYNANSISVLGDINSAVTTLALGHEVSSYFLYKTNGTIKNEADLEVYQEMVADARLGDLRFVDTNGDGNISDSDRVYSGSGLPDYELGLNVNLSYRGFDIITQWFGSIGHEIINGSAAYAYNFRRHEGLLNMWTPENPTSDLPIHRGTSKDHVNYTGTSDLWLEDGTYVRLRVATLGYTLPGKVTKKFGVNNLRLYVSAQNPLTFTKYTGFDPEVGGNNVATRGLDSGRYPISKQFLFGLELDF